ncbi:MAG: hypothetical protein HWE07_15470 [Cytophagia bacterium]|nr:hypothetical protein [Cytophagia bacterium]
MDIQSEKLDLIQWLAELDDLRMIKLVSSLKLSNELREEPLPAKLKSGLDEAIQNIEDDKTFSLENVKNQAKKKFPELFK